MSFSLLKQLCRHWPAERRCLGCAAVFQPGPDAREHIFCPACRASLPRRKSGYCPSCGEPAAWPDLPLSLCGRCLAEARPWSHFLFHGLYEGLLRKMLLALKFGGNTLLGHALGKLLATHPRFREIQADAVVPIPLHAARLAGRGYNQALEIARPLAAELRLPLRPELLNRQKATAPQSGASLEQRRKNIRGAFACPGNIRGMHLLLVDDTLTTGSTLEAACKTLLEAGAASLGVAVVSRTARHHGSLGMR